MKWPGASGEVPAATRVSRCLRAVNDDVILRYLLQLAQALKHESYFQCDLVEFLLERALNNQHIGHSLFWELKAEMNSPAVGLHFGLVLEAYLSAAPEHLKILMHTNVLLEKCRATRSVLFRQEMPIKYRIALNYSSTIVQIYLTTNP